MWLLVALFWFVASQSFLHAYANVVVASITFSVVKSLQGNGLNFFITIFLTTSLNIFISNIIDHLLQHHHQYTILQLTQVVIHQCLQIHHQHIIQLLHMTHLQPINHQVVAIRTPTKVVALVAQIIVKRYFDST